MLPAYLTVKVSLILANALCFKMACTPPNPPARSDERSKFVADKKTEDMLSRHVFWWVRTHLVIMETLLLSEVYIILSTAFPAIRIPALQTILLPSSTVPDIRWFRLTTSFICGSTITIAGCMLRMTAFRLLGRNFTFELSIKEEHKLTTDGPYAFVRHPSYTGLVAMIAGTVIAQMGSGSWWLECGLWASYFGGSLGLFWVVANAVYAILLISRIPKEDAVLRNEFKEQWVEWSQRTPYKLVPFLY